MEIKNSVILDYESQIKDYEETGYKFQFDLYYLKNIYSYFKFLNIS